MGVRIAELQNYFAQSGPVQVTCRIGPQLSSGFSLVINGALPVSNNQLALGANGGEILLHEEEIYKFGPSRQGPGFLLVMDGGAELLMAPAPVSQGQPVF